MSFQAYLDNAEKKSGKTPQEFVDLARAKGFGKDTKTSEIVDWMKDEFDLGHGHASALAQVIKSGAVISSKHVDSGGTHSDPSDTLRLDGLENRNKEN